MSLDRRLSLTLALILGGNALSPMPFLLPRGRGISLEGLCPIKQSLIFTDMEGAMPFRLGPVEIILID